MGNHGASAAEWMVRKDYLGEDTYLLMLREGLPSESFLVLHPLSLCTQDLFHHISSTAITSAQMAHIHTGLTYLGGCIGRTTGTSAEPHHRIVGNIIAHIEYLLMTDTQADEQVLIDCHLVGTSQMNLLYAKSLKANLDGLHTGSRNDSHVQTALHSQLQGISVLDIHRTQGSSLSIHGDSLRTQDSVHIKEKSLDLP